MPHFKLLITEKNNDDDFAPLHRSDFIMIKYPRKGRSIPHERVFTMDFENLVLYVCFVFLYAL